MTTSTTSPRRPTSARRLCVAAGIALLGAGVIVATSEVAPPPDIEVHAVELIASPFDPYFDLVTNTFDNLVTIGTHWLEDPLPVLTQLFVNGFDYLQTTINSFVAAGQSFINGLVNLPDQLQTLFSALNAGDFEQVLAELLIIVFSANPLLGLLYNLLAIPYHIVGNFVSAALEALHALQVPVGVAALSWVDATLTEIGLVAGQIFHDLATGDFAGAINQLIEAPALILNAALNGDTPGQAGLLTPFQDLNQTGLVDALVNYLPQAVAHAIGAPNIPITDDPVTANLDLPASVVSSEVGDLGLNDLSTLVSPVADTATMLADVAP